MKTYTRALLSIYSTIVLLPGLLFQVAVAGDYAMEVLVVETPLHGANVWPPAPPGFREAMDSYWAALAQVGDQLLRAFALAMELPEAAFLGRCAGDMGHALEPNRSLGAEHLEAETAAGLTASAGT